MRKVALLGLLLIAAGANADESIHCAAYVNHAGAEPPGYAQRCMNGVWAVPFAAPSILAPTDTAYTLDIGGIPPRVPGTLYSFVLNGFATQTPIGASNPQVYAMDFNAAGTTLYGVTADPNAIALGTFSTTTGAFTLIAPVTGVSAGYGVSGLTINGTTGAAFLSAVGGVPATSRLYSLNLVTFVATLIGRITAPTDVTGTIMIDIAVNCAGAMYGHNISDDSLYAIDPTTGAGILIGTHGLAANFSQGMDFDNQDGTLYGFIYTGAGTNRFGTFNLATGAFTTLVQDNPLGEFEGAIPTTCQGPNPGDIIFADGFEPVMLP